MPSGERSFNKYGVAGLLASSATRGWSNLAAELRSHSGTVAWNNPQPDAEICVDVRQSVGYHATAGRGHRLDRL
jgi:AraC family transcriptional regulator